jgi:ankyrin repeat protein
MGSGNIKPQNLLVTGLALYGSPFKKPKKLLLTFFPFQFSGMTALHLASKNSNKEVVKLLLSYNADQSILDVVSKSVPSA